MTGLCLHLPGECGLCFQKKDLRPLTGNTWRKWAGNGRKTPAEERERRALVGASIRRLRLARRMSQQDAANLLHVSRKQVWQLEHGNNRVPDAAVVAAAFGVPEDEVLPAWWLA